MVSPAIAIAMVSAVAVYIGSASAAEPIAVHESCMGKTFCHIKPDNYPQEEIDRLVIENLPHLHRMKRSVEQSLLTPMSSNINCQTKSTEKRSPYILNEGFEKHAPLYVVQSEWFQQGFQEVTCAEESVGKKSQCFEDMTTTPSYCNTKKSSVDIFVYDHTHSQINNITLGINVGCVCEV